MPDRLPRSREQENPAAQAEPKAPSPADWRPPAKQFVELPDGRQQRVYRCRVCRDTGYIALPPPPADDAEWPTPLDAYQAGLPDNAWGRGFHAACPNCRPEAAGRSTRAPYYPRWSERICAWMAHWLSGYWEYEAQERGPEQRAERMARLQRAGAGIAKPMPAATAEPSDRGFEAELAAVRERMKVSQVDAH